VKIPVGIEKVLYLAATDVGFREALFADRAEALARPGVNLLPDEAAVLKCIPDDRLELMIAQIDPAAHGKRFMQKVAACAVALAATTAGAGCTSKSFASDAKSSGTPSAQSEPMKHRPKACRTENESTHFLDADDLGDNQWAWGTGGVRSDRPREDEVWINEDGDSGQGDIDHTKLNEVIGSAHKELMKCLAAPEFKGKDFFGDINVTLRLRRNGTPLEVLIQKDDICDPSLTKCVENIFKKKRYPRPKSKAAQTTVNLFFNKAGQFDESIKPRSRLSAFEVEGFAGGEDYPSIDLRPEILNGCYRKALQKNKALRGKAKFRVTVTEEGTVSEVVALESPEGGEELARQIMPWLGRKRFPKPVSTPASVTATFVFSCPPKVAVDVVMGDCTVVGNADAREVVEGIRFWLGTVKECYEEELGTTPDIEGEIVVAFEISEKGRVENLMTKKESPGISALADCAASRMKHWWFKKPESGKVAVTVPIMFSKKK
jgi:TonB family protein